MKKHALLSFLILILAFSVQAQSAPEIKTPGRTSFYAELGGPGILFSANLDTRFKKSHLGLGGRAGIGFVTASEYKVDANGNYTWDDVSVITVPVQLNYILGKANSPHTFEVGGGFTYMGRKLEVLNFYDDKQAQFFGTFAFMYRRQPIDGGFTWRVGFTPMVAKGYIMPFGAVGVGYNF